MKDHFYMNQSEDRINGYAKERFKKGHFLAIIGIVGYWLFFHKFILKVLSMILHKNDKNK